MWKNKWVIEEDDQIYNW